MLRPVVESRASHTKDSADFVDILKQLLLDDEHLMVFFDVKLMFTSAPINFAAECCKHIHSNDPSLPSRSPLVKISPVF